MHIVLALSRAPSGVRFIVPLKQIEYVVSGDLIAIYPRPKAKF